MYSVIIPSIGRIKFLNELLESIYNQSVAPKEIIILLDKNNICKENAKFIKKSEICKIIYCEQLNLSQKRNYGASISNSKYLIFSDDDDIWQFKKGELTIESLKTSQVVCHEYTKFGSFYQKPKFLMGKEKILISLKHILFGSNIFGGGSGIAALKEVILTIPFNEKYTFCEDYDWWIKILLSEIKIQYLPNALVKYRVHSKNMTSSYLNIFKFNLKIFDKLFYKSIILFLASIVVFFRSIISIIFKSIRLVTAKLLKEIKKFF